MILYFIRVKNEFVRTVQEKLVKLPGVVRFEQVSVLGVAAKAERNFKSVSVEHTMLIVRAYNGAHSAAAVPEIEQILAAGMLLDMLYQYEYCEIKDADVQS